MILLYILIWCALGYAGGWIAARKGYPPRLGVISGILGGPCALLVFALLPMTAAGREQAEIKRRIDEESIYQDEVKTCSECGREVAYTCRVCPRCGGKFATVVRN